MEDVLRQALETHASLSIIGMSKNAGKTTVLNRLIGQLWDMGITAPALTSIGRDGETIDVVTGTEKPGIWVREGTLIATAADMLRFCDITREVIGTTGMGTPLGEVVLLRALSDGFVQLAGPSMRAQLSQLVVMLEDLGAERILIDGALSRKSLAAPTVSEAAILCAGASQHPDMETVIADTAYDCTLLTLPRSEGDHPRRHRLGGAATESILDSLAPKKGDEVTVEDGSRILLTRAQYERWTARGIRFTVQTSLTLCCVCVNPVSANGPAFEADLFRARMAAAVPVPVINVKEG